VLARDGGLLIYTACQLARRNVRETRSWSGRSWLRISMNELNYWFRQIIIWFFRFLIPRLTMGGVSFIWDCLTHGNASFHLSSNAKVQREPLEAHTHSLLT
jgi:hypothetical protein